jgi:hypothetical protein
MHPLPEHRRTAAVSLVAVLAGGQNLDFALLPLLVWLFKLARVLKWFLLPLRCKYLHPYLSHSASF